ncbi:MAG: orotidine 5'-phosphate decarboxylase [Bacteroidia bacterium]|nr:MAG: orotidine 5'-phosphate decarboxylase [Bacteroidia bacterium]
MSFADSLRKVQQEQNSLLCIGLDPDPDRLPTHLGTSPRAVLEFNKQIIESTGDLVCAYKMNLAFYEALGDEGWSVIRKTVEAVPGNVVTIGDAKRGDIGNTAERSALALFGDLKFSAVTVNPYMGFDSVEPYLKYRERGVFLLALTSNPGSKDFQRLKAGLKPVYERVVRAARKWNEGGNIGLVVGATHPRELKRIRKLVPTMPLLIPGIGHQGGDVRQVVRYGCDRKGFSAVINVGRSVIFASREKDFTSAVRREAMMVRDEIRMIQAEAFGA